MCIICSLWQSCVACSLCYIKNQKLPASVSATGDCTSALPLTYACYSQVSAAFPGHAAGDKKHGLLQDNAAEDEEHVTMQDNALFDKGADVQQELIPVGHQVTCASSLQSCPDCLAGTCQLDATLTSLTSQCTNYQASVQKSCLLHPTPSHWCS